MQTFIVDQNPKLTAKQLDDKRLGKMRVETKQIMNAIFKIKDAIRRDDWKAYVKIGWSHHPAVCMWYGFEHYLGFYYNAYVTEWLERGFKHTMKISDIMPGNMKLCPVQRAKISEWAEGKADPEHMIASIEEESRVVCWKGHTANGKSYTYPEPVEFVRTHSWVQEPSWHSDWESFEKVINTHRYQLLRKDEKYYTKFWNIRTYKSIFCDYLRSGDVLPPMSNYYWPENRVPSMMTIGDWKEEAF